jgi:hypothetical protein
MNRRIRLSPVAYAPLPNVEQYTAALTLLSGPMDTARFGHKGPNNEEHFQALQNLLHPERVVEAANQVCVVCRLFEACTKLLAGKQEFRSLPNTCSVNSTATWCHACLRPVPPLLMLLLLLTRSA